MGTDSVLLGAWADIRDCTRVLDVGAGTGVVALMLMQRLAEEIAPVAGVEIRVNGVEIHPPSAACARRNFESSPWGHCLEIIEAPVQVYAQTCGATFHLIVSNPPFFSEKIVSPDETRRLGRNTATLSPGELLQIANKLLSPRGRLCVILPVPEGKQMCEKAVLSGLYCTEEVEIRTRAGKPVERLLLRFEKDPYRFERKTLNVYGEKRVYTPEFQELTKAFYLK